MQTEALTGGFTTAPTQAAEAFRAVMRAMARPGTVERITGARPPLPLSPAAGAVILTLCDPETPLHLAGAADTPAVRDWITFHTGAPLVAAARASFALGSWQALLPLTDYPIGSAEYPDRSTTLIVEMPQITQTGARLTGPGIETAATLSLPDIAAFQRNAALYPLALDFLFTAGDHLAALPRSTRVEAQ